MEVQYELTVEVDGRKTPTCKTNCFIYSKTCILLNDLDCELVNFYYVVKNHWREFVTSFNYELSSREVFYKLKKAKTPKDPVKRAQRFYYLLKLGYGGQNKNPFFAATAKRKASINIQEIPRIIKESHKRLARVTIECLDFE